MDDNRWESQKKIRFSIATEKDVNDIIQFLHQNFLPDEPVNRNIRTMDGNGWLDCYLRNTVDKVLAIQPIMDVEITPACIIARSTSDNSIVGCRIGEIISRENVKDESLPPIMWIGSLPSFLPIPKKLIDMTNLIQHFIDLSYSKCNAFSELKDTDRIYFAANVCVSDKARGCGLGTELVKRGYDIAKKAGCGYTYILASSIYSQKIFHKLGNCDVLHEVKYEDYKYDKKGRPFLIDPREHKVIQVLAIKHLAK